ncbi:MAG TPA: phosphoribosyl-AMP cyclohydrolase [Candidatus Lokiarchaeia archaeon]|nr:phosphoribosyl-AMP cyclohydrolase [Candidatus Lokiarchaeia archaeon]
MGDNDELERSGTWLFDFTKLFKIAQGLDPDNPVVPVVVQDAKTKAVLIVAYANQQALETTFETGMATFWSTSRNELWIKGKSSGDILKIKDVRVNCEQNSLLYLVEPVKGGACHVLDKSGKSMQSCYYRRVVYDKDEKIFSLESLPEYKL